MEIISKIYEIINYKYQKFEISLRFFNNTIYAIFISLKSDFKIEKA